MPGVIEIGPPVLQKKIFCYFVIISFGKRQGSSFEQTLISMFENGPVVMEKMIFKIFQYVEAISQFISTWKRAIFEQT